MHSVKSLQLSSPKKQEKKRKEKRKGRNACFFFDFQINEMKTFGQSNPKKKDLLTLPNNKCSSTAQPVSQLVSKSLDSIFMTYWILFSSEKKNNQRKSVGQINDLSSKEK